MKQNEPVRVAGIGKGQVAFNVGRVKSLLDAVNPDRVTEVDEKIIKQGTSSVSFARTIASSAVTSLKQDVQNNCFEMIGIRSFFLSTGGIVNHVLQAGVTGSDLNWNENNIVANSQLYTYNPSDRYIYVRKPGWYLVRVNLFAPLVNAGHEWGIRFISNIILSGADYERYPTWMDYNHQAKHPYVNGTAIFNAPATEFVANGTNLPGFKIRLHSSASNVSFSADTTIASLQIIRLSDLEHTTRQKLTQV